MGLRKTETKAVEVVGASVAGNSEVRAECWWPFLAGRSMAEGIPGPTAPQLFSVSLLWEAMGDRALEREQ